MLTIAGMTFAAVVRTCDCKSAAAAVVIGLIAARGLADSLLPANKNTSTPQSG